MSFLFLGVKQRRQFLLCKRGIVELPFVVLPSLFLFLKVVVLFELGETRFLLLSFFLFADVLMILSEEQNSLSTPQNTKEKQRTAEKGHWKIVSFFESLLFEFSSSLFK